MDNRLKIALHNPCRFAGERSKKIYCLRLQITGQSVETVITADDFSGFPVWHISASVIKQNRAVNIFAKLTRREIKTVADYLQNFLADAGAGEIRQTNSVTEFHYYKNLSLEERAVLNNLRG